MAGKTIWFSNRVLDTLRGLSLNFASGVYVGLFTTLPLDDGTGGVEVSGGGYVRMLASFSAAASGVMVSSADVIWTAASASWGTVVGFGIFDASTGGNLLYVDCLRESADLIDVAVTTNDNLLTALAAHNLIVGDRVTVNAFDFPAPLTTQPVFFVRTVPSATTLTLGLTSGAGADVDITTVGVGVSLHKVAARLVNTLDQMICPAGTLELKEL